MQVLAPGLRLGWATAAPALLEKLIFHLHGSILGPTAMSQVSGCRKCCGSEVALSNTQPPSRHVLASHSTLTFIHRGSYNHTQQ